MNPAASREDVHPFVIIARAAADARRVWTHRGGPIALVLDEVTGRVLSITPASELPREFLRSDVPLNVLSDFVLLPGLVNAHTHLDLTDVGPRPHDPSRGFMPWIDMVRRERPTEATDIAAAVRRGVSLCRAGGTAAVGDIAGAPRAVPSVVPFDTLAAAPLASVSYLEFFAIGNGLQRGIDGITGAVLSAVERQSAHSVSARLGLQPHAPNTVSLSGYRHALDLAAAPRKMPLCTHLAESPEEREFIAHARGPQRELLEALGLWNDAIAGEVGRGLTPIEHLAPILATARSQWTPFTAVHCNDVSDTDLDILSGTGTRVVYCPRSSDYFGAPERLGPHRYREMLARGIPVALGTDSIINLPAVAADPEFGSISVLDEMRHLYLRDGTDAATLFAMGTVNGACALDAPPGDFQLSPGSTPLSIIAIDVSESREGPDGALRSEDPRSWVLDTLSGTVSVWTRKNAV